MVMRVMPPQALLCTEPPLLPIVEEIYCALQVHACLRGALVKQVKQTLAELYSDPDSSLRGTTSFVTVIAYCRSIFRRPRVGCSLGQ